MDFMNLFLSPKGRIGQQQFWIGIAVIFVVGLVVGMVLGQTMPLISGLVSIALAYPGYCVMAKRFQDMGKSGMLAAIPYGIFVLVNILALLGTMGIMGGGGDAMTAGGAGALAGAGIFAIIGFVIWLVFVIWAGVSKGDPAPNAYGPPPGGAATA